MSVTTGTTTDRPLAPAVPMESCSSRANTSRARNRSGASMVCWPPRAISTGWCRSRRDRQLAPSCCVSTVRRMSTRLPPSRGGRRSVRRRSSGRARTTSPSCRPAECSPRPMPCCRAPSPTRTHSCARPAITPKRSERWVSASSPTSRSRRCTPIAARDVGRIAIVDWDVHHGNGTQDAFFANPDVLTISIHQDGRFPRWTGQLGERGAGAGVGANINVPLPPGSGHGAYARRVRIIDRWPSGIADPFTEVAGLPYQDLQPHQAAVIDAAAAFVDEVPT